MNAVLAQFKKGQKDALALQAQARQDREQRLAKAEQAGELRTGGGGSGGGGASLLVAAPSH